MSKLIKWTGSKESQSKDIISQIPTDIKIYNEPFAGGGSVFLNLLESNLNIEKYLISDLNSDVIDIYNMIKNEPEKLIEGYYNHYQIYNSEGILFRKQYYHRIRNNFNLNKDPIDFYFINRNSINGMIRYNSKGEFNASCHFSRPGMEPKKIEALILKYHNMFKLHDIDFFVNDYKSNTYNDFCYLDPPYENTNSLYFVGFSNTNFIQWLNNLNCRWILSYDGNVNGVEQSHEQPNYKRKLYLESGNSSIRSIMKISNKTHIQESLYLNY